MKLPRLPSPTPKKNVRGDDSQDFTAKSLALSLSLAEASTKPAGWKELLLGGMFSAGFGDGFLAMDFCGILIFPRDNWSTILTKVLCAMKGVLAYLMLADENNKMNPNSNPAKMIGSFLHTKDASIRFTKAIINKAIMAIKIAKNPPRENVKDMARVVKNRLNLARRDFD